MVLGAGGFTWYGTDPNRQVFDLWLLDTQTPRLTHVPGTPAFVQLKRTAMAWSEDGRLVLLARTTRGRDVVAVWRPGQKRLALKSLPTFLDRVDGFAVIR